MKALTRHAGSVVVSGLVLSVLGGVTCYTEFGPQPLACQLVSPPASPTAPDCVFDTMNDQVHDTLATTLGFYFNNPVPYYCGYEKGRDYGAGCVNLQVYVRNTYWGHTAVGPDCVDPL